MSDKPPKTQTDREKLEEMQREQRELEAQLAEDFSSDRTALEDKGATEAKLYEAEQHAGLDTPEGQVALARAKYIKEKLAHDNWKAKLNRVYLSMGIKKGAAAEKRAGRDKLDRTKKEYDESRVALGNKMLRDQRSILEKVHTDKDGNVDHKAVDLALAQYKATEILKTVVIDERQAIIDAKAAESATEMVMLKKVLGGYMGMKPWKRRALGISLGLAIPAYGVAAAGFGIAAVVGFAGLGAVKIGRSLLTGTVSTLATGYIHRRRNLGGQKLEAELEGRYRDAMGDNNFKENSGYIKLSELQSFDQKGVEIEAERAKYQRGTKIRMLSVGILMAGASAGIGAIGHGDTIAHTLHLNPSSGHGKQLHDIFGQDDQVIKEGPHAGQNLRIIKDGQGKVTQEYYSNDGKHLLERDTPDGAKYKYDNYSHRLKTQEIGDEKITYRGDGKTIATKDTPHENVIYNEDGSLDVVENKEAHTIAWYKEYNNKNVTVRYQDAGKKEVIEYDDTGNTVTKHTIDGKDVLHTSPPAEARPSAPAGAKVEPAEGTRPPSSGNGQKPAPNTDKEAIKNIKAHLDANRVGTPHPPRVPGGTGEDVQAGQRVDNTPPPQTSPVTEKTLLGGNALTDKRFMENYRAGHKGGLLGDDIFKFERYTNSSHVGHTETPLPMHEVVSHPDIDFNGQTYVYHRTDLEGDHYISLDDRQEYVVRTDHPEITINQAVPATAPSVSGVQPGGVPTTISNEDMLANGRPLPKTPTRANFLDDAPRSRPTIPSSPAYHAETHTELERSFDKHDLAVEDIPKDDHIHGMTYSEWNHASDQMLSRTPFSTPDDYAREDAMQRVFGSGHKEFITTTPGGAPTEHVALTRYDFTYKNNLDALQKTPAKDFVALMRGDYIDKAEIPRLKNLGFLDDKGKPLAWEGKHEFERLTRSFGKVTSHPEPYPDETMREYIGRITKKIHEARDGTIYSIKDGAIRVRHVSQTSYAREYGEPAVYNGYKYNGGMSHPVEMTTGGDYGYGEYYPGNRGVAKQIGRIFVDAGIRVINSRYGGGYGSYGTGF